MIKINLLDWRSKRVQILNHRFAVEAISAAVICALLTMSSDIFIDSSIATIKGDIQYLEQQITAVEGDIKEIKDLQKKKDLLLSRRKVIESLQESRPLVVKIFDNIVRVMPDGVYLDEFERKDNQVTLSGLSDSNYTISVLMENVQKLDWVKEARLGEIKTQELPSDVTPTANMTPQVQFQLIITTTESTPGTQNANPRN
jgi:type IV pilus assembly protein PilN